MNAEVGCPEVSLRIELHPRCSLTPSGARQLFVLTSGITLAVSSAAALYGAWPAYLFAGLELMVLYGALRLSLRRGRDGEIIEVTDREVRIVSHTGEHWSGASFLRHWARVRLAAAASPSMPTRLFVECQGKRCEIGTFLTEQERADLARRLGRVIGRTSESPDLASQIALEAQGTATTVSGDHYGNES